MKKILCAVMMLVLMATAANCLAEESGLLGIDDQSVIHFCNLPWDADPGTVVATITSVTGLEPRMNSDNIYDGLMFGPSRLIQLPELSEDCYLVLVGLGPQQDGSWWVECQLVPAQLTFDNAMHAVDWFFDVNVGLWYSLGLSGVTGVQVLYPQGYTGERTIETQPTYGEMFEAWARAVDDDGVYASLLMAYGNAVLALESMEYDGSVVYSCWLTLYPA